ncbi:MAG: hypothetical protein Q8934_08055 [Bacillota bacterium]|nr:hypothetical protein [Bacillota bacterium]
MDKQTSGKIITIKINGEQRSFLEEPVHIKTDEIERDFYIDSAASSKPIEETAATQEMVDESFDWIIPEQTENGLTDYPLKPSQKTKKSKGKLYKDVPFGATKKNPIALRSILFSVLFAILIGASFGVVMLKLVVTNHGKGTAVTTNVSNSPVPKDNELTSGTSATIPSWTSYVVQGGIYSTKDTAIGVANTRIKSGIPAEVIDSEGKNFLFLGVANSIEMAKGMMDSYKKNGVTEVYAKPLIIPEKKIINTNQVEQSFLDSASSTFQILSDITAGAMVNAAIAKESVNSIKTVEGSIVKIDNKQLRNNKVKELKSELVTTIDLIKAYEKSSDLKSVINAQQHLLKYLSIYYSI